MINPFSSQKHFLCSDVFVRRGQERPNNKTRYFIILCILLFDCLLYTCVADDAGETELRGLQTNLAKLYGFAPENIADVSLTSIKQILEAPPEIKDATFVEFHGAYRKSNFSQALDWPPRVMPLLVRYFPVVSVCCFAATQGSGGRRA